MTHLHQACFVWKRIIWFMWYYFGCFTDNDQLCIEPCRNIQCDSTMLCILLVEYWKLPDKFDMWYIIAFSMRSFEFKNKSSWGRVHSYARIRRIRSRRSRRLVTLYKRKFKFCYSQKSANSSQVRFTLPWQIHVWTSVFNTHDWMLQPCFMY